MADPWTVGALGRGARRPAVGGTVGTAALALGAGLAFREAWRRARELDLGDRVALVTGGTRGLGLLIARELVRQGCSRLAICARDGDDLRRARRQIEAEGATVVAMACDVAQAEAVERWVAAAHDRFGRVDILVNNAGVMQVGPAQLMTREDFAVATDTMFWGVVSPTLAVLPIMRRQGHGRIVNITSIGGKVSVPHLIPYCCAKFAAVAFSEGLHGELARDGIAVTTVVPGLMRTGSYLHAEFKGRRQREYVLFSLLASAPVLSMDAERAARRIVRAARRGEAELVLTLPANVLVRVQGLFPGLNSRVLGLVDRLLPAPGGGSREAAPGLDLDPEVRSRWLDIATAWGRDAARRFNEYPPGDQPGGDSEPWRRPEKAGEDEEPER